jgi:hypothetical protein
MITLGSFTDEQFLYRYMFGKNYAIEVNLCIKKDEKGKGERVAGLTLSLIDSHRKQTCSPLVISQINSGMNVATTYWNFGLFTPKPNNLCINMDPI